VIYKWRTGVGGPPRWRNDPHSSSKGGEKWGGPPFGFLNEFGVSSPVWLKAAHVEEPSGELSSLLSPSVVKFYSPLTPVQISVPNLKLSRKWHQSVPRTLKPPRKDTMFPDESKTSPGEFASFTPGCDTSLPLSLPPSFLHAEHRQQHHFSPNVRRLAACIWIRNWFSQWSNRVY
jgi:hypothetical protein